MSSIADRDDETTRESLSWEQARRPLLMTVAVLVALALAAVLGRWSAQGQSTPGTNSIEAGFARDMTEHHGQAVDMSLTVMTRTTDPAVRTLSYDIARTQENQRGQMMAWLQDWGLPLATSGPRMEWMKKTGHQHTGLAEGQMLLPDGRMPGMASQADLQRLQRASGKAADVLFLQLMITHHKAGVEMARAAEESTKNTQVSRLAGTMVSGQQSEISLMTSMLTKRGAKPSS